ncbi:elongation factor 4 [Candidatus Kaiserbacteria bacterium RIFCSPHIGHO2_02_FULL_50_50]|uniref:Elongation factor 4 n=1 Tax=Candidatus Kaiserbacteria bacterium RIFCSPHIGHO2_02_FULL_50_50 TaxID=1798492 RepID=A0A1F6DDR5_9BACT|nr:MAG: elongation factor 4 [Candidatus Kaiserbacteria bacterium RIFCSPHIGHO2_02_FULL_50_50]OGG89291.1 MAG: elongation factor 4 [Candidatus Kaiserbacteria bacterium RIFCSPLOWO2_12_FULL_50_10]
MHIRNFSIIAHIDHGKSTLADRLLEVTKTVETRKMQEQVLDSMDLERERGITIKLQPARMHYTHKGEQYILNLIDTPGHIDFSYEVSRALGAVEGVLLLVDATQGVQAQTITVLHMARAEGLTIIPVLTKTDMMAARVDEIGEQIIGLLGCAREDILEVSGKTGAGVPELLATICEKIPAPLIEIDKDFRGLIFDSQYSNHRGIIAYFRVMEGSVSKGAKIKFLNANVDFIAQEIGIMQPEAIACDVLKAGEIGYVVTGIKEPGVVRVGDTLAEFGGAKEPLPGYSEAYPVVWASLFPESQDDFTQLRYSLDRLRLSDSSLSYEEETSGMLGRGFRCGFLGMLHLEIVTERLKREFNMELIITAPSISYEITNQRGEVENIYAASRFPDITREISVREPWILGQIIVPPEFMGNIMQLLYDHEGSVIDTETFADGRAMLGIEMPLRELMRGFFDKLKNATSGFGSLSYEIAEMRPASVARLDVLVADELVPAFSRVIGQVRALTEARAVVDKLYNILPRQQFKCKIQAEVGGKAMATKTLSAITKDVAGYLYGGDISRKMKLRDRQKEGKKDMLSRGKVHISHDIFMKMVKSE